jgi:hypothetical protein
MLGEANLIGRLAHDRGSHDRSGRQFVGGIAGIGECVDDERENRRDSQPPSNFGAKLNIHFHFVKTKY